MSTTTQRPTPETDAVLRRIAGGLPAYAIELRDKALSLERERDEARELVKACMAAMPVGNIQTHTPENLASRIGDLAHALASETNENETMRGAIKEAHEALTDLDQCRIFYGDSMDTDNHTTDACATARAKLQPFLK